MDIYYVLLVRRVKMVFSGGWGRRGIVERMREGEWKESEIEYERGKREREIKSEIDLLSWFWIEMDRFLGSWIIWIFGFLFCL